MEGNTAGSGECGKEACGEVVRRADGGVIVQTMTAGSSVDDPVDAGLDFLVLWF